MSTAETPEFWKWLNAVQPPSGLEASAQQGLQVTISSLCIVQALYILWTRLL
jgi:hypothetical protein